MPFYLPKSFNKLPVWALFTRFFSPPPAHNWRRYCPKGSITFRVCQRRGRDSNPRWTEAHNGFRDRPIQPLWHLPIQPRNYNLNIHIIVQFGVKDILHVLFFQLLRQYFDRFFFAMHKEYFFDRSFYTCGILYK